MADVANPLRVTMWLSGGEGVLPAKIAVWFHVHSIWGGRVSFS